MEQRAAGLEGRQVKCLTADAGHVWISSNVLARQRRERMPSIATYLTTIELIERQLKDDEDGNR
jgi:hypothetical protein